MPMNVDDGSGADWIDHYLEALGNGPAQTGLGGPKEGPGQGNPYGGPSGPGPMGGGGGPAPQAGPGGDKFSRGMEWLGADIANNGSGRMDRAGQYQGWDQSMGHGVFDPADVAAIKGLFGSGGDPGNGNPKEPPGQGNPYGAAVDPFASMAGMGPQNGYAGPSVPLGGVGAPVSPFQQENVDFLNRNQQAAQNQSWSPPAPPAPSPYDTNPFGALAAGAGLGNGSAGIMSPTLPFAQPTQAPFPQQAPPSAPPINFRDFLTSLVQQAGGAGSLPNNMPMSNPQAQPYAKYADQSGIPGMPSLYDQHGNTTGFQGAGLNRQIPANLRGSSIGQMIAGEEPFLQNALIAPDDGTASPSWNQLMATLRGNRGAPAAGFRPPRGRPRF